MGDNARIDEMRRRVEKDPASIAFASLAEELRKAGDYDEAVRVCRTGLERHPTYLSARVTLGRTLLALQHYGEARTEIEYVLHAAPDNLLALKCMNELEAHPSDAPKPHDPSASEHVQSTPEPAKPNLRIQTAPEPAKVEPPVSTLASPKPQGGDGGSVAEAAAPEPAKVEPPVFTPASPKPQSGDSGLVAEAAPAPAHVEPPVSTPASPKPQSGDGGLVAEAAPALAQALSAEAPGQAAASSYVPEVSAPPNGGPPAEPPVIGELEDWQARIQADRARRSGGSGPHPSTSARGALSDVEGQDRPR